MLVVVGDDDGGRVAAQSGDDELADGAGVAGQRHRGVLVDAGPVVGSGPVQRDGLVVRAGQAVDAVHQGGRAHPQGGELDAAGVELAEDGLGGDLLVHDQHLRVGAGDSLPVVAERDGLPVLGGLGDVGVGVDQVAGAGVLGEERQHRAGPLGPGRDVVLFQHRILAPVHDGVEVQVEDRLARGGQPGADHLGVQGGQEPLLVVVGEPVGVIGERGFLRQDGQPGEQGAGRVAEQVIDVGDPAGAGQLQREQGQQPRDGRDDGGARIAGGRSGRAGPGRPGWGWLAAARRAWSRRGRGGRRGR